MKALILAGGKGTRLKPYTTNFPKPLMPVGNKPILEIVLSKLKNAGISDIVIATGHLSEMIRLFFQDGSKMGLHITYSIEDKPLGTGGPIKKNAELLSDDYFLVMNGDVLTDLDFGKFVEFHKANNADITIGTAYREQYVDFGVVELDNNNNFTIWNEKPTLNYLVSMGIYMFSPRIIKELPEEDYFNIPDIVQKLAVKNFVIKGYVHNGYWLDIGRPEDYEKACRDYGEELF
jgi:NDP-sugar pyrophosphorylase family protein